MLRKATRRVVLPPDPFDPNTWPKVPYQHRIYGDDREAVFALVDEEDYWYFSQWRWHPTKECPINRRKVYLRRSSSRYKNGVRTGVLSIYLHVEIMKRTGTKPPSAKHKLVDHRFGNGLDCRRLNLRWATGSMNSTNVHGSHPHDLMEQAAL